MGRVGVYCGSSAGHDPAFRAAAGALAEALLQRGLGLVYGGASVGLMGAVCDAMLAGGGEAIGVIPRALTAREDAHRDLPDLRVVSSMHERKALMVELADAFVVLPGGIGTLDELFETYTWAALGLHDKPLGLCNVGGYFDGLIAFLDHVVEQGFLAPEARGRLHVAGDPAQLLDVLAADRP